VCAQLSFDALAALNSASMDPEWSFSQRLFAGLTVTFLVAGYLCGLTAACYRPLRRFGAGILLGVTIVLPLAFLVSLVLLAEGN
jgi:hypothetical protein